MIHIKRLLTSLTATALLIVASAATALARPLPLPPASDGAPAGAPAASSLGHSGGLAVWQLTLIAVGSAIVLFGVIAMAKVFTTTSRRQFDETRMPSELSAR